jgi:RNA polymerase sigma factor (sigma-70 family)
MMGESMMDDRQLLARYVAEASEEAFAELTRLYAPLVYSAALRQVRNEQLAQDVTQVVFANLARKARSIPEGTVLSGWLHRDARYTAVDFIRAEARRLRREQQFVEMNELDPDPQDRWNEIRPLLDEALTRLTPADRDALLLRFFEQRDFAGVGAALGASAEAARKRVDRALERLREHLAKRGITTTAAALGGVLTVHAVESVPAELMASLATGSLAAASRGGGWISNLMLMNGTKIAIGTALMAGILATLFIIQQPALATARADQAQLQARLHNMSAAPRPAPDVFDNTARERADLERLRREAAALRTKIADFSAQAQRLTATKPWHKPGGIPLYDILTANDARDVSQATPAAAMQTYMWAWTHNDTNRFFQLTVAEAGIDVQHVREKMVEICLQTNVFLEDVFERLLEDQPGENNDRWVVAEEPGGLGPNSIVRFRVRQSDTGWRRVFGADGNPVYEQFPYQP